jgi:1,4-alpha-glucan branching enzyme
LDKQISGRRTVLPLVKPVTFRIQAPNAKNVWLVGKFTSDGFEEYEMTRTIDGYWECTVELKRGHHEYHFLVDDVPTADPHAIASVPDDQGRINSVVEVG